MAWSLFIFGSKKGSALSSSPPPLPKVGRFIHLFESHSFGEVGPDDPIFREAPPQVI